MFYIFLKMRESQICDTKAHKFSFPIFNQQTASSTLTVFQNDKKGA